MANMLSICFRNKPNTEEIIFKLKDINNRIMPENITYGAPKLINPDNCLFSAIYNPTSTIEVSEDQRSFCLGKVFDKSLWYEPSTPIPDGTYAMIRSNNYFVEAITDVVASRTMWYYYDQEKFIISSSQRAIIMLLGNFEFNNNVIPWMLSAGNLGPGFSWDKRLTHITPNTIVELDRKQWKLKIYRKTLEFKPIELSDSEHKRRLEKAINKTFDNININSSQWILPLSGGYDSRALLLFINSRTKVQTITWGTQNALTQPYSDAVIAKKLAEILDINNTYFTLDRVNEDPSTIIRRFIENGEGRIDNISGYIDGFSLWKKLYDAGIEGTIRGDVPWPTPYPYNIKDLRGILGFSLWDDYDNLPALSKLKLPQQKGEDVFLIKDNETIEMARDRLYSSVKIPYVLAALNDLKAPYGEFMNPILSKNILEVNFTLPDHLRNNKLLFKKIVDELSPPIPYAKYKSIISIEEFLRYKNVREFIYEEILNSCTDILSYEYRNYLIKKLDKNKNDFIKRNTRKIKSWIRPYLTKKAKMKLRTYMTKNMNFDLLAFRTVIIIKMYKILSEDSKYLRE